MSSGKKSYTPLQDTPMSLTDLSEEDKDLFTAALYRPLETWVESSTPEEHTLLNNAKKKEKERISALPDYLLQKQVRFSAILPRKPHPRGFCKTHGALHPYIIGTILHKIRHEVTGPQFNMLVPLQHHPAAKSLADSLRRINAYWTKPNDHGKVFSKTVSPGPVVFQENGCDACVLAAISGNTEVLEALRTSSFSKRRSGGRLVGWIDCWLDMRGPGVRRDVRVRSERNAHIIRKLKCGKIGTTDRWRGNDKRVGKEEVTVIDDGEHGELIGDNSYWTSEVGGGGDGDEMVKPRDAELGISGDYFSDWI